VWTHSAYTYAFTYTHDVSLRCAATRVMCSWTHYNVTWNGPLVTACNRWGSLSGVSNVQVFRGATLCDVWKDWVAYGFSLDSWRRTSQRSKAECYSALLCPCLRECSINQIVSAIWLAEQPWHVFLAADGFATKPKLTGQSCDFFSKTNCKFLFAFGRMTICGSLILLFGWVWTEIVCSLT